MEAGITAKFLLLLVKARPNEFSTVDADLGRQVYEDRSYVHNLNVLLNQELLPVNLAFSLKS